MFFKIDNVIYTQKRNREVQKILRSGTPSKDKKPSKKSFWFEFADKQGVNPHKSAWAEYDAQEKRKKKSSTRYCSQCGNELIKESRFCERCGFKVKKD